MIKHPITKHEETSNSSEEKGSNEHTKEHPTGKPKETPHSQNGKNSKAKQESHKNKPKDVKHETIKTQKKNASGKPVGKSSEEHIQTQKSSSKKENHSKSNQYHHQKAGNNSQEHSRPVKYSQSPITNFAPKDNTHQTESKAQHATIGTVIPHNEKEVPVHHEAKSEHSP